MLSFALAGIPPADVIKFATRNAARALGVGDKLGTIEPGKLADLVVMRGNPLADIRNTRRVRLVMKSGRVYDPAELLASVKGAIGPRTAARGGRVDAAGPTSGNAQSVTQCCLPLSLCVRFSGARS